MPPSKTAAGRTRHPPGEEADHEAEPASQVSRGRHSSAWKNVVLSPNEQFSLKRNALLREAARAFSARGYHETSLDDVARTLGVTKPALYYYVKNKGEILYECHVISHDLGDQALAYAEANGRNGRERVVLLARRYIELITGELGSFGVLGEFDALEPDKRAAIAARRDAFDGRFRDMIAEGRRDGSVRDIDPKLTVFFFMGAVNWMTRWFRSDGPSSGAGIASAFSDLLDAALRPGLAATPPEGAGSAPTRTRREGAQPARRRSPRP